MSKKRTNSLLALVAASAGGYLAYRNGEEWVRQSLIYLSQADWARQLLADNSLAWQVASRFVAGETIPSAIQTAQTLNQAGMSATLDYLGESVTDADLALSARDEIARLLTAIAESGVNANVSVKPTQLGLAIDPEIARDNLRFLLQKARSYDNNIRLDMEDSPWIDATLNLYRTLRDEDGLENVGVVIQSYLYRSESDVADLVAEGASVRLVKGAYLEPAEVAYPAKGDTDASYVRLMRMLLGDEARKQGVYAGIATHDEKMLQATIQFAQTNQIPPTAYEFQMLYGIRRERQISLVQEGYPLRIYVPFGKMWFPYFMRRLAERPANIWFFVSSFFR